ncbi:MAG: polyprenyl synthetase family protein, partial [Tepidiformaceae bacterium]
SDLREGTVTLPGLLLLERYPENNPIKRFFTAKHDSEQRLQEALTMIRSTEVLEVSMYMARDYVRRANEAVAFLPECAAKQSLADIGEYVLNRKS